MDAADPSQNNSRRRASLLRQYIIITSTICLIVLILFSVWAYNQQQRNTEQQMLAEARVLNTSVMSTWAFIDNEQYNINTDRDGTYNFKGIYCSLVGKSVAKLFTKETNNEYTMRYVRFDPRNVADTPDDYESAALQSFYDGNNTDESYGIVTNSDGKREFRYVAAIRLSPTCLTCHGQPAGELDVTGTPKEGLSENDIGGAVSITMPVDLYESTIKSNLMSSTFLMLLFLSIVFATSAFFFRRQVTKPLNDLEGAADAIGRGELNTKVETQGSREVTSLAMSIAAMERELDGMYTTLEEKVDLRTKQYHDANELLDRQKEKIAEQNALLKQTNKKLLEENEYRTNIISLLSHELRTPLTTILAYVDLWLSSDDGQDEQAREYCEMIRTHSLTLLAMVDNILDIARLDAGIDEVNKEAIDPVDLVNDIASTEEPIATQKGVRFTTHIDPDVPIIMEEWRRLRKAILNLVTNAIKFTDKGGSVDVSVSFDASSQTVRIAVSDTGIGIPEDQLDSIFNCFVQADASISRKYNGTGLGLSLVKETMDSMAGTVSVQSVVGSGSTFTLVFPVEIVE